MADDFKDISHLYKVTPSAKTIIDGEDLVETKQKSKAYAWCDVLQSVTGLILGSQAPSFLAKTLSGLWFL